MTNDTKFERTVKQETALPRETIGKDEVAKKGEKER